MPRPTLVKIETSAFDGFPLFLMNLLISIFTVIVWFSCTPAIFGFDLWDLVLLGLGYTVPHMIYGASKDKSDIFIPWVKRGPTTLERVDNLKVKIYEEMKGLEEDDPHLKYLFLQLEEVKALEAGIIREQKEAKAKYIKNEVKAIAQKEGIK